MSNRYPPVALPDHPFAAGLQALCLSFEGAWEDYPWGEVVYKAGEKLFAMLGGGPDALSLTVKAAPLDADALVELPHVRRAAYVGRYGWVTLTIDDPLTLDHARELVAESYRLVAARGRRRRR